MIRVAIPVQKGKLSTSIIQSSYFEIFEIEQHQVVGNLIEVPHVSRTDAIINWLKLLSVEALIISPQEQETQRLVDSNLEVYINHQEAYPGGIIIGYIKQHCQPA